MELVPLAVGVLVVAADVPVVVSVVDVMTLNAVDIELLLIPVVEVISPVELAPPPVGTMLVESVVLNIIPVLVVIL